MDKYKLYEALLNLEALYIKGSMDSFECGKELTDESTKKMRESDSAFYDAITALKKQVMEVKL